MRCCRRRRGRCRLSGGLSSASLSWGAATRQRGCGALQRAPRTSAGFTPSLANRVAQPTGTSYTDTGLAAGTYYYRVTAEDAAGNVGPALERGVGDGRGHAGALGAGDAVGGRVGREGDPVLGGGDRQRRCAPLQRPPRHQQRLHAHAGNRIAQPSTPGYVDTTTPRQLLLQGHRRGRGRQHQRRLERGERDRQRRHDRAERAQRAHRTGDRLDRQPQLDRLQRRRRRPPLQRPPRQQRRLHPQRRQPDRATDRHQLRRQRPRHRHLLLQGHRRRRRRQHQRRLQRGRPPPSPTPPRPASPAPSPPPPAAARSTSPGAPPPTTSPSAATTSTAAPRAASPPAPPTGSRNRPGSATADTNLAPGTYFYKLTAEDAAGNIGPLSNTATATVADTTPPSTPTLTANGGAGQTTLSWTTATDNVAVTRYNLHRSTSSGFTPSTANRIAQPTSTSYTDTGLSAGTYYYKLTAEDAAGNLSTASNQATSTVTAPPVTGLVAAYGLDTGTGTTITDQSGTGNNGTLTNTTWAGTGTGKYGNALTFNGTNATATIPDTNSLDLTTGMTLEAWVRPTDLGNELAHGRS